jgi:hypothetical protein
MGFIVGTQVMPEKNEYWSILLAKVIGVGILAGPPIGYACWQYDIPIKWGIAAIVVVGGLWHIIDELKQKREDRHERILEAPDERNNESTGKNMTDGRGGHRQEHTAVSSLAERAGGSRPTSVR